MHELDQRLTDWTDEGIISPQQAARIAALERDRVGLVTDRSSGPGTPARPVRRVAVAEAVGYLGAVLALSAVALIVGDLWPGLRVSGQLALVGLLTVLAGASGRAVHGQPAPAMARLTGVLWAATAVGAAWFAGIAADLVGSGSAATMTTVGAAGVAVALPLLLVHPALPLHLAALTGLTVVAVGALDLLPLTPDTFYGGALVAAIGCAWLLLGRGRWIAPQRSAETLGAIALVVGWQVASFGELRGAALGVGLVIAAGLVALAVQQDAQHLLIVGSLGAFLLLPQLVIELFGDAIGAPATLLVIGLLLVLLAVGLGRARREVRPAAADAAEPSEGPATGTVTDPGAVR